MSLSTALESLLRAYLSHYAVFMCGNVQLSPLYLCTTVCLLITLFQFPGECFWLICRFKTILLALCGTPWIWIASPHENTLAEDFFSPQHWLTIHRSLNILPIFFYCHHSNVTKCAKSKKKLRIIFLPTTHPLFCHISLSIFGSIFFSFLAVNAHPHY